MARAKFNQLRRLLVIVIAIYCASYVWMSASSVARPTVPIDRAAVTEAHCAKPVDVVLTWVDSAAAKQAAACTKESSRYQCGSQRFRDNGELRYALRSLDRFSKLGGKIFLVTADGKGPAWLEPNDQLRIVSHAEIFERAEDLPTTNSHAIEWSFDRIPGLSEHFVYLNDDFFLLKDVTYADFFSCNDQVVMRVEGLETAFFPHLRFVHEWFGMLYTTSVMLSRLYGSHLRPYLQHTPYAFLRSTYAQVKRHSVLGPVIRSTVSTKVRSKSDVQPAMVLLYTLLHEGRVLAPPVDERNAFFNSWVSREYAGLNVDVMKGKKFACIQDPGESGWTNEGKALARGKQVLRELFPTPSQWEKRE